MASVSSGKTSVLNLSQAGQRASGSYSAGIWTGDRKLGECGASTRVRTSIRPFWTFHVRVGAVSKLGSIHGNVFDDLLGLTAGPLRRNVHCAEGALHAPLDVALAGGLVDAVLEHIQLPPRVHRKVVIPR